MRKVKKSCFRAEAGQFYGCPSPLGEAPLTVS